MNSNFTPHCSARETTLSVSVPAPQFTWPLSWSTWPLKYSSWPETPPGTARRPVSSPVTCSWPSVTTKSWTSFCRESPSPKEVSCPTSRLSSCPRRPRKPNPNLSLPLNEPQTNGPFQGHQLIPRNWKTHWTPNYFYNCLFLLLFSYTIYYLYILFIFYSNTIYILSYSLITWRQWLLCILFFYVFVRQLSTTLGSFPRTVPRLFFVRLNNWIKFRNWSVRAVWEVPFFAAYRGLCCI